MAKVRGLRRSTTANEAVARALSMVCVVPVPPLGAPSDAGGYPINYRLEDFNGGDDPFAVHCANWSYGLRRPTSDCIGLVLWASGIDRKQPGYKGSRGEWLNCASLLDDAHGSQTYCAPVPSGQERPGDWLVSRGHIGLIVRPATKETDILVVDCSPRHGRTSAIGLGYPWSEDCEVLRYKGYKQ